jgi:hypothetical protein
MRTYLFCRPKNPGSLPPLGAAGSAPRSPMVHCTHSELVTFLLAPLQDLTDEEEKGRGEEETRQLFYTFIVYFSRPGRTRFGRRSTRRSTSGLGSSIFKWDMFRISPLTTMVSE